MKNLLKRDHPLIYADQPRRCRLGIRHHTNIQMDVAAIVGSDKTNKIVNPALLAFESNSDVTSNPTNPMKNAINDAMNRAICNTSHHALKPASR